MIWIKELESRHGEYLRKQLAFLSMKRSCGICPKCGCDEFDYENPRTGNGLYNCAHCGYSAHERKFKSFKIRKYILRRWRK